MPDYKKKKKHYRPIRKRKYSDDSSDLKVKKGSDDVSQKEGPSEEIKPPRLIKGKKQKRIVRAKIISIVVAVILLIIIILKMIFPVGIIEMFFHFVRTLGVGEYPIQLAGNEVVGVSVESDHYYVLTNTDLYSITNNGKIMDSFPHGYNTPVVKSSATRSLIYGQGKNEYDVYINGEKKFSKNTESGIICGDISDSGVFAVASYSKTYASTVSVFDSKGALIYKWNSASDIINSIVLSKNGKKLAVSTVNSSGGKKYSKIYIFNFKDTNSEETFKFDDNFSYDLVVNNNGFFVVLKKSVVFIDWDKKQKIKTKSDYNIKLFKTDSKQSVAVFTRQDNDTDNYIYCFDKNGSRLKKFSFSGTIKDVSLKGSSIFILSGNQVVAYNNQGEKTNKTDCDNLARKIVAIDSSKFCLITDEEVSQYQF